MTIRPPNASPTAPVGPVSADAAEAGAAGASPAPPLGGPANAGDRIELSEAAQALSSSTAAARPEIETAQLALRAEDTLGPARLHELREKVRTGAYDTPEAITRIADTAAADVAKPTTIE